MAESWTDDDEIHLALYRLAPTNPLADVYLTAFEANEAAHGSGYAVCRFVDDFGPMLVALNRVIAALGPVLAPQEEEDPK